LSEFAVFPYTEGLEDVLQEVTGNVGANNMDSVVNSEVRELCKAVSQEQDSERLKRLLDELLTVLDERQLLASLL
jgi:NTP pyrophosphatase (non-canonical NTP hydrolase)